MPDETWWKHGVIYQIYPRSFADSDGDGVGDLPGITSRLDHVQQLGARAIWLSPIFVSPMVDFGYDVADYCDVDPCFGTLDDLDALVAAAHARDLKVMLDWVPNHTSDQHPWFEEARASRASNKRDWYVFRDPEDGGPPNNWISVFGGSAWELDDKTGQYYLHSYCKEQPDLQLRNPEVVEAMRGVLRFWLDRGVDGFRIDVIHRIAKHPDLPDNPADPDAGDLSPTDYDAQAHEHDENHPDVHGMVREVRKVLDAYDDRAAVGEVYLFDPVEVGKYCAPGELHLAFNFSILRAEWSAESFATEVGRMEDALPDDGWPTLVLSNHDQPRQATRYDHPERGEQRSRACAVLLLALRGTPFLYYGEEIGMRQAHVPAEWSRDPVARTLTPERSRDGCRSPMQWASGPGGGFTEGKTPWLPFAADHDTRTVEAQLDDATSVLTAYRKLLALRRATAALHAGDYARLDAPDGVFAWERRAGPSVARVAVSFRDDAVQFGLGDDEVADGFRTEAGVPLPRRSSSIDLAPDEGIVLVLEAK